MTLPASGTISFNDINVELGVAGTTTANINQSSYRTLAGVPSGTISLSNFYGKSNSFSATISSNQTNLNLRTWALANGWGGTSAATITVGSSVYIYSTGTGTPGLTIDGAWPGGVTLINSGFIMGMGGAGGDSVAAGSTRTAGSPGGSAISLGVNCTITNNSYIGGGGGGGASESGACGGGGAGGGAGGSSNALSGTAAGGTGGGVGASGGDGVRYTHNNGKGPYFVGTGGGGGRISPGTGGAGGTGTAVATSGGKGGGSGGGGGTTGGAGGSAGSAGASAIGGGGGGGWGATGGNSYPSGFNTPGGAGGKAIALNGYTATRNGSGTTYGTVS